MPRTLALRLTPLADRYALLHAPSMVVINSDGTLVADLLATREHLNKSLVGLVTGSLLTIRSKRDCDGEVGTVRFCPLCGVPASQEHFLNSCAVNSTPREILDHSLPLEFRWNMSRKEIFTHFMRAFGVSLWYSQAPSMARNRFH